ncbi:hypothetical protein [Symbiopectobacterium purcellii]|uniref:hypothetical protein n=1 Tax=Symbiopectobacterium purcellii TaxID=2871826 RepID=UPI003F852B3A
MRHRDLLARAFYNAQRRDERNRLVASTTDIIKEARKLSSREIGPGEIRDYINWYGRGWVILEETPANNNVYIKAHNY